MGWIIFAGTAAFFVVLFNLWIRFSIVYNTKDSFIFCIKVLFIRKQVYPAEKKKVRLSSYSLKKLRKKDKKKPAAKSAAKKKRPDDAAEEKGKKTNVKSLTAFITRVITAVVRKFAKHLRIDIARICIRYGGEDAANTAVMYGVIAQAVSYIIGLLNNLTNVRQTYKSEINVIPDYLNEGFDADINITFRLKVWHFISISFAGVKEYLAHKAK